MAIVGTGPMKAVAPAQTWPLPATSSSARSARTFGTWAVDMFRILLMTGSFACGMAFHNCAARYIYAIGRENVIPGMRKTLGATHSLHGSPHIAGFVQTVIATVIVLFSTSPDVTLTPVSTG